MPRPVEVAVDTYMRACREPDAAVRSRMFGECLADEVRMVTRSREIRGRAALVQALDGLLADPNLSGIRLLGPVDALGTTFRYRALADFHDGRSAESFDVGEIDGNGRIVLLLSFAGALDEPSSVDTSAFEGVLAGAPDAEILAREAALRGAQLGADVVALDRLLADDLLFTGPDGKLASKQDDLEAHRSGLVRFREHEPLELRIRRVGPDTAVVALLARLVVEVSGGRVSGRYRYTRVWAREGGPWRVVGGHVVPV